MKNCVYVVVVLWLCCLSSVYGKGTGSVPFFEGFEDAGVRERWVLNAGTNMENRLTNKWCVSGYEPYMGDSCLIISNNAATPSYTGDKTNASVAYMEFELPAAGEYDLNFQWRCVGETGKDGLYVCWEPQSTVINSSVTMKPQELKRALKFGADSVQMLCGQKLWQSAEKRVTVKRTGAARTVYRLYFVWYNNGAVASDMAVCIDNVQLAPVGCGKPTDMECKQEKGTVELSWKGDATAEYEVMYRAYGSRETDTVPGRVSGSSVSIPEITKEGVYDFFVRGICASGDTTVWSVLGNRLVYFQEDYLIDYMDMTAKGTEYTIGTYGNPYSTPCQPVDSGAGEWQKSRHTLHYMPGETDPYTGDRLKTVSVNAVASVRIGNSEGGAAESVSYTYKLKPNENTVLLIDYAIVYESPNHDTEGEQPKVQIEVLDAKGMLINPCNEVYFYPPLEGEESQDTTWKRQSGSKFGKEEIWWRDWHTMGINLSPLAEEDAERTIKVRLTVRDCVYNDHFAHAFFSIRSTSAELEGYSCGEVGGELSVSAPPGFDYEWYRPEDRDSIWGRERTFSIKASEADTFECKLIFKGKPECYFKMPAYLVPRVPVAKFEPEYVPRNCENRLRLRNTGGVMSNGALTSEECEHTWTVRNMSTGRDTVITDEVSPELTLPDEGATVAVRLHTRWLECDSVTEMEIEVPPIDRSPDTLVRQVCSLPYQFGETRCDTAGLYVVDGGVNEAGCEIGLVLDVRLMSSRDSVVYDTICEGEEYEFGDFRYTTSSPAEGYMRTIKSANGECDSVVIRLHLNVIPRVLAEFEPQPEVCADDKSFVVGCVLSSEEVKEYSLEFGQKAKRAGFTDVERGVIEDGAITVAMPGGVIRPDWYEAEVLFRTEKCGSVAVPLRFTVNYPVKGVMVQKWNDAVVLLNRENNYGGFEYEAYQWYKNGEVMVGETKSYLYVGGGGVQLEAEDEYSVLLTRVGDTAGIMSCAFVPEVRVEESEGIVLIQPQGERAVYMKPAPRERVVVRWYALSGVLVKECVVAEDGRIEMPSGRGVYVLQSSKFKVQSLMLR